MQELIAHDSPRRHKLSVHIVSSTQDQSCDKLAEADSSDGTLPQDVDEKAFVSNLKQVSGYDELSYE